jgi:hypothetical protein
MYPPECQGKLRWSLRPHQCQLKACERSHRDCRGRKEQIGPRLSILSPDSEINRPER